MFFWNYLAISMFQQMLANGFETVHRDTYHATRGAGRYALGLLWYRLLTGQHVLDNSFCDFDEEVTAEQVAKVRAAQFKDANEKFLADKYEEAVEAYSAVLSKYLEVQESIGAVENVAMAYVKMAIEEKDAKKKDVPRITTPPRIIFLRPSFEERIPTGR